MIYETHFFSTDPVTQPISLTVSGTVAFVLFQSDSTTVGTGFSLSFTAGETYDTSVLYYEDQNNIIDNADRNVTRLPASGFYRSFDLSTVAFMRRNPNSPEQVEMNITSLDLEVGTNGECKDKVHLYHIRDPNYSPPIINHFVRYTPVGG